MRHRLLSVLLSVSVVANAQVPFTIQGPGVQPTDFRVTVFATGIDYVLGMDELPDGSILAAITDGPKYFSGNGRIVRFVDANRDGVADGPGKTLFTGLQGGLTSLRIAGDLVFVTGQEKPIDVLRLGATPDAALTSVGKIDFAYPSGSWLHPHSALAVRGLPTGLIRYELIFQLGSRENFAVTPASATVSVSSAEITGVSGTLLGDSIYSLTLVDNGAALMAESLTQLADGLRNPAGFLFHPTTGDFYFEDNGIDGLVDANEPTSADELNVIRAADYRGAVEHFGFPTNYIEYRTGRFVGGAQIPPLVAFLPLPNPLDGEESEGPNNIAFAPPGFPDGLNDGIFVGFHGKFSLAGIQNEENALVFVDLRDKSYFHFIPSATPGVGHLDGLLTTRDSLFISDLSKNGAYSTSGAGVIYQIKSLAGPKVNFQWKNDKAELTWSHGLLERATVFDGEWSVVASAPGPYVIQSAETPQFFRTRN
jgi:glucose/arabinose dehydrogenase